MEGEAEDGRLPSSPRAAAAFAALAGDEASTQVAPTLAQTALSETAPAAAGEETAAGKDEGGDADEIDAGRYMLDASGQRLHKWKVEYSKRGGGGAALCRDMECLYRHEQAGVRVIEKGCLRIGRRVLMAAAGREEVTILWYHARCIFNTFTRARKATRIIESEDDLEGFADISTEDQALLRRILAGSEDLKKGGSGSGSTPEKRGAGPDMEGVTPGLKRRRGNEQETQMLKKGDRVWTFCKVRPPVRDGAAAGGETSVKSQKPELAMVVEEVVDGSIVVQFESQEHEKDRNEAFLNPRKVKVRGWLRYPRLFEGKKQRVPVSWLQLNRKPPRLCSCSKQIWGHECCGSDITCSRGTTGQVWGVGQ
eukprot:gnl/TRDRNA2_/TRDRNA2_178371_c0_seq1.p1 gnl/TRDRNA2_/TRDRNA2_178371_c0~~gnl/TRDRNA2_/TRDRNA2_178371_c0_seq1.p1  ORF type:complete len:366 (-),score=70.83 gnl/TRDRNA2_/TRDRNA2_178371_c0_seq1:194-1291(-)